MSVSYPLPKARGPPKKRVLRDCKHQRFEKTRAEDCVLDMMDHRSPELTAAMVAGTEHAQGQASQQASVEMGGDRNPLLAMELLTAGGSGGQRDSFL